jgi:hypothetical protein
VEERKRRDAIANKIYIIYIMVKQTQEQKQNVKVVINLAETKKKKRKPRRRRIREPPQGKSSFQQILRDNQAPQVIVRRIYDQSPYLDELQRLRNQQPLVAVPADGVKQPSIPIASQANQRGSIVERVDRFISRFEDNTQAVAVRAGERMSMPTDPNTSALQGTPEPPAVETPAKKPRKLNPEKDRRFKQNRGNKLGARMGYGNVFTMGDMAKQQAMREARQLRYGNPSLDMLAGGTNPEGQV